MKPFETRVVNVFGVFVCFFFTGFLLFSLYGWYLYLNNRPVVDLQTLIGGTLLTGLFSVLFFIMLFPKVTIDEEMVLLRTPFTSMCFTADDVRLGRLILKLGGYWYIPFKRKECMSALEKIGGAAQVGPQKMPMQIPAKFFTVNVTFLLIILFIYLFEDRLGLNPWVRAPLWGAVTFSFTTMFFKELPVEFKIWKLDKTGSAILMGALLGIAVFLAIV